MPRNGDDENPGTEAAPFETLERACDAVRQVNDNLSEDLVVYLRDGTSRRDTTLQLDDRDSGSNGFSVVYRAYPGERPAIIGAMWIGQNFR